MNASTSETIAGYRPRMPEAAGAFARKVVAAADPPSGDRAKALLFATSRLAAFGAAVGLELDPEVLLHPSVIERFVVCGTTSMSAATRRTIRTNLRFVAARIDRSPAPVALSRERAKAPYRPAEIAAWLALADAQPTTERRMRAQALICLGAGAGLVGADLRRVRGDDVIWRSGGVVVEVRGRRPRAVPVLAGYHPRLVASASFAADGWLIGGVDPDRHNVTTPLISSLAGGADLGRLELARLRSTWLAACAEAIGLKAFMDAAGVVCTQRLGDLVASLPATTETQAVALLGASR